MSFSNRWVSFDCFGTLVDWQVWFAEVLGPLGSHTSTDVIRAYHAHERLVERDYPHRSYKDVLVTALGRAAADCGIHLSSRDARNILMAGWASMRLFDDADHSFHVPARSGRTDAEVMRAMLDAFTDWADELI